MNEERLLVKLIQEMRGHGWIVDKVQGEGAPVFMTAATPLEAIVSAAKDAGEDVTIYWRGIGRAAPAQWYIAWGHGLELLEDFESNTRQFYIDTEDSLKVVLKGEKA